MQNKCISYLEFRKAAIRNISICDILLKKYDSEKSVVQKQILYKTFYLGGYVVEFLYKFSLFSHLNLSSSDDVYSYRNEDFQKKWKVHNFNQLSMLCESEGLKFSTDIPYFGNNQVNPNVKKIFEAWDVQIRYSLNLSKKSIDLEYNDLTQFLITIKDIEKKINRLYV